jgi:hypothetical protein
MGPNGTPVNGDKLHQRVYPFTLLVVQDPKRTRLLIIDCVRVLIERAFPSD